MLIPDYGIAKYDETLFKQTYEAAWYQICGHLFVSRAAISGWDDPGNDDGLSPSELECDVLENPILRVTDNLKRYSEQDGWYHA
jgi:hypothetical protein